MFKGRSIVYTATDKSFRALLIIILLIGAVIMIMPFYWMIISSFKPSGDITRIPPEFIPRRIVTVNYTAAFRQLNFLRLYMNSLIVSISVTAIAVFTSALVGFVLGKFNFKGKELVFLAILATMMIPFEVRMLPLYKLSINIGINNTYIGLMFPYLMNTFGIFLFRQHMYSIPNDLLDSATIDGCSEFRKFLVVILPLSKQVVGALSIFVFVWMWDDFLWPLLAVSESSLFTIPLGMAALNNFRGIQYGAFMASSVLAILPAIIVFIIFQKQIVRGIAITGMKG